MSLPTTETEQWRYSPIGELALDGLQPATEPTGIEPPVSVIAGGAARATIIDGFLISAEVADGWQAKGVSIAIATDRLVDLSPSLDTTSDDVIESSIFDAMHSAFSPGAIVITVPEGVAVDEPIIVRNHHAGVGVASFPHLIVEAGEASSVVVIEIQTSVAGKALSVPVVELKAGKAANLRYVAVQEHDTDHWQIGRQLSNIDGQATLNTDVAAFGARYARIRTDSRLAGRGSTAKMSAGYYGDGDQIHDFRVFQHHDARDTRSDLLFKGAQDARSGSIYTGMIHIHEDGAGSNAFQTNRNVKLSDDAWAWSVPNLEIENNEVHCSHASTVSPVDGDQQFYLQARGVPPVVADRLIVAGFYREVIDRMPMQVRDEVRRLVDEKLDRRDGER